MTHRVLLLIATALLLGALSGCDLLGIETATAVAARREAEGKAVGGACRHSGRAIEDCYALNKKAEKAAVFAGWREMNDYMRENKIEAVTPQLAASGAATGAAEGEPAGKAAEAKPAEPRPANRKAAAKH
jgi:hypothetical protein